MVIGLLGLIALYAGEYLINMAGLNYDGFRVEGTVRDACVIIAAATDWKNADTNQYGATYTAPAHFWQHDGTPGATGSPGDIDIDELLDHPTSASAAILQTLPAKRYHCANCDKYELTGWDRGTGSEDDDVENADDLILKLYVDDERQAEQIARRLPLVVVNANTPNNADPWYELIVQVQGIEGAGMSRPLCGP